MTQKNMNTSDQVVDLDTPFFHLDLGDTYDGAIGMTAWIQAPSPRDAIERFKEKFEAHIPDPEQAELCSFGPFNAEYIFFGYNLDNITIGNVDRMGFLREYEPGIHYIDEVEEGFSAWIFQEQFDAAQPAVRQEKASPMGADVKITF